MENITKKEHRIAAALSFEEGIVSVAEFLANRQFDGGSKEPDYFDFIGYYCDLYGVEESVVEEALNIALERIEPDINQYDFDFKAAPDASYLGDY